MEWIKTLWQLLQEIVEQESEWYSLIDFLLYATDEDRKRIQEKLVLADYNQFYKYMDWINFVNSTEVYCAVSEYYEHVMDRPLSMGECPDMYDIADDYIAERGLKFENDED